MKRSYGGGYGGRNAKRRRNNQSYIRRSRMPSANLNIYPLRASSHTAIYSFRRMVDLGTITTGNLAEFFVGYSFNLNALPNYAEFTALFDQYRISKILVQLWPDLRDSTVQTTSGKSFGLVANDYDDSGTWSTWNDGLQYGNVRQFDIYKPLKQWVKPRLAVAAYSGAFNQYMNVDSQWVDAASPAASHYGMKFAFPITPQSMVFRVTHTYFLQFRNSR